MSHAPTDPAGGSRWPVTWLLVAATALGFGATATLSPAPAVAQDGEMAEAKKQFMEGKKLYEQEKHQKAVEHFLKAYELSERGELLYNIGQAYRKAGKLRKAEKYFQKYLNKNPNPANEDAVVNRVIEIQQKLAARMTTVKVETATEGRKVYVEDEKESRCTTPCSVSIDPGRYTFKIRGEGMQTWSKKLSLERAGTKQLNVALKPEVVTGRLHVRTDSPGGTISIPKVGEQSLPLSDPIELEVGERKLTVRGGSGGSWTGTVTIEEGETTRLMVPMGGSGGSPSVRQSAAFGLAGTSVALFVGGILVGQSAKQTHSLLSAHQRRGGRVDPELLKEGRREQTTANVLLGAGATTLLSGIGLYTWDLLASGNE
ncbi:MAG: tetratricopeptide repeat protein [Bradymonadaceae bacterium]